jgi:hypothetical protein
MLENEEPIVNKFMQLVHYFINWFKCRFTLQCNIWCRVRTANWIEPICILV